MGGPVAVPADGAPAAAPAGALPPVDDPATRRLTDDAVLRVLDAVGRAVEWCGADLWAMGGRRTPRRVATWYADEPCASVARGGPTWVRTVPAETWDTGALVWRPASGPVEQPHAAVAVPVRDDTGLLAVLCVYGERVREPDPTATALLQSLAGLMARWDARPHGGSRRGTGADVDAAERAMALVDVFAFTVEVAPGPTLVWRYFGPNSAAVFGEPVPADRPLTDLLHGYAEPEDLPAVQEFEAAVAAGRPIEVEFRVRGRDALTRWVSWRGVPRRADGILLVDGVATDVTARRNLASARHDLAQAQEQYLKRDDAVRERVLLVRDANDNVLQRLFAAGLRLQVLQRRLTGVDAHAAAAIVFHLDQAANDLREVINGLNEAPWSSPGREADEPSR